MKTYLSPFLRKWTSIAFMGIALQSLNAQTIQIQCNAGLTNCFSAVEPNFPTVFYDAVVSGNIPDSLRLGAGYSWSVVGGSGNNSVTSTYGVTWNNTTNSPGAHRVSVSIGVFRKSNGTLKTTLVDSKDVTVLYLSPITSLSLSGSNYSNGQTVTVPCSTQNISITANGVTTNPSEHQQLKTNGWNQSTH